MSDREEYEVCPDDELDETLSLEGRAPFTQIPDWIILAKISPQAVRLYCTLAMHLNASRGDRLVWPFRQDIANMMGLSRAKSVDGPFKELADIRAIRIIKRRYNHGGLAPSRYIVRENPPEGYKGLKSNADFYSKKKADKAAKEAAEQAQPSEEPLVPSEGQPPTDQDGGPLIPSEGQGPESAPPYPSERPTSPPEPPSIEEDEVNSTKLNQKNTSHSPPVSENRASAPTRESRIIEGLLDDQDLDADVTNEQVRQDPMSRPGGDRAQRASVANKLGDRWCAFLKTQGTEFPKSEVGTSFTKNAEFNKMITVLLISYSVDEVWDALTGLYARRGPRAKFPSRPELEAQLDTARERRATAKAGPSRNDHAPVSTSTDLVAAANPELAELVEQAVHGWTVTAGHYVPGSQMGDLRALFADALSQRVTAPELAATMVACYEIYGETCPRDWQFGKALAGIRGGKIAVGGRLAVVPEPLTHQLSKNEAKLARGDAIIERYRQQEAAEEAAAAAARQNGGAA